MVNDDHGKNFSSVGGGTRRDRKDWPAQWFAQDTSARVVVGRDLTVLAINHRATATIERNANLVLRDGVLTARDRRTATELGATVASANCESRFNVVGADSRAALLIEAVALNGADSPVALTLRDLSEPVEIDCAVLEPIFGVTPGEHQVILRLLHGQSSCEIAEQSGKSILTVRTHVKRAYGKIGVKTRGQLFARLLPYLSIR
jgi:DNA-binding CsgD family transcriptional regulator